MFVSELIEEKWNTQRKMAEKADYDIKKILDNAEKAVEDMLKEHGVKLKYADLKPSYKGKPDHSANI